MKRRAFFRTLGALVGLLFVRVPAEAKEKPMPKNISGLYAGRIGSTVMTVRVVQSGETARYVYRFRGGKRRFQGSGSAKLKGSTFSSKGVSALISGKYIRLLMPGGRSVVLKKM